MLTVLRGFKFVTALVLGFNKIENDDETKFTTFYSNSKAETIVNESDIDDIFESVYTVIMSKIQKYLGKGSGWITDSVINHIINISEYYPLSGSSYIKLPKELNHSRKGFINIQNFNDGKCFKWCLVRYLNPADLHPARVGKIDEFFRDELDLEDILKNQKKKI